MTIGLVDRLADSRKVVRTVYSFFFFFSFAQGRKGYLIGFMLQLSHYEKGKKKRKKKGSSPSSDAFTCALRQDYLQYLLSCHDLDRSANSLCAASNIRLARRVHSGSQQILILGKPAA